MKPNPAINKALDLIFAALVSGALVHAIHISNATAIDADAQACIDMVSSAKLGAVIQDKGGRP